MKIEWLIFSKYWFSVFNVWLPFLDRYIDILRIVIWPVVIIYAIKRFEPELKSFISGLKELDLFGKVKLRGNAKDLQVSSSEKDKIINTLSEELRKSKAAKDELEKTLFEKSKNEIPFQFWFLFERTYRLIFGSQLRVLKELKDNEEGLSEDMLALAYRASGWYERNYDALQWVGFLTNITLLVEFNKTTKRYKITQLGILFLNYLEENKMTLDKPY